MMTTVIRPTETAEGVVSDAGTRRKQRRSLPHGGESSNRATLDHRRRPPDQRAVGAPGGWGTRLGQPVVHEPMELFGAVRALDVRSLAGPVIDVEVPAGTELVREHEPIGTFFVIRHGSAVLFRGGCAVETLGAGDCFGEIDPRASEPPGYAVVTSTPTRLMTFSAFGIRRLCDAIPGVRERILEQLPPRTPEFHSLDQAGARSGHRAAPRDPAAPLETRLRTRQRSEPQPAARPSRAKF